MKKWVWIFSVFLLAATGLGQVLDPAIVVSNAGGDQGWPQACYNPVNNEYLVVWEEYRNQGTTGSDIWGQIVLGDGTLRGDNFSIVSTPGDQYWPRLDFDPVRNRYLIVFQEHRYESNGDIAGVFVDQDGKKVPTAYSLADSTFMIDNVTGGIYICSVAYNYIDELYLAVWGDYRDGTYMTENCDIYGQVITAEGEFRAMPSMGKAAGDTGYPIANEADKNEMVCDVSFCAETREWFVVFGEGEYSEDTVKGMRVNRYGQLVKPDGTLGMEKMVVAPYTYWCPDGTQPRVQFSNETPAAVGKRMAWGDWAECLVVWCHAWMGDTGGRDIYGQRIGFVTHAEAHDLGWNPSTQSDTLFYAAYVDASGSLDPENTSNVSVCNASQDQSMPEVAYGAQDDEFMTAWRDFRLNGDWNSQDVYGQQLTVKATDGSLIWMAADRVGTTAQDENTGLATTADSEGRMVAVAHNTVDNEFLVVYEQWVSGGDLNLQARRVAGSAPTAVEEATLRPQDFTVEANYPNPFNPETTIAYRLSGGGVVRCEVLDVRGRVVKVLGDGVQSGGRQTVVWDGTDRAGQSVATGVYFYRIHYNGKQVTRKMMLLR